MYITLACILTIKQLTAKYKSSRMRMNTFFFCFSFFNKIKPILDMIQNVVDLSRIRMLVKEDRIFVINY